MTIVKRLEPILDINGDVAEWKKKGYYFFVHDDELRNSYDTFKVIERLTKVGFKEEQLTTEVVTNNYIIEQKKGVK